MKRTREGSPIIPDKVKYADDIKLITELSWDDATLALMQSVSVDASELAPTLTEGTPSKELIKKLESFDVYDKEWQPTVPALLFGLIAASDFVEGEGDSDFSEVEHVLLAMGQDGVYPTISSTPADPAPVLVNGSSDEESDDDEEVESDEESGEEVEGGFVSMHDIVHEDVEGDDTDGSSPSVIALRRIPYGAPTWLADAVKEKFKALYGK